jgi:hypothetical protein
MNSSVSANASSDEDTDDSYAMLQEIAPSKQTIIEVKINE